MVENLDRYRIAGMGSMSLCSFVEESVMAFVFSDAEEVLFSPSPNLSGVNSTLIAFLPCRPSRSRTRTRSQRHFHFLSILSIQETENRISSVIMFIQTNARDYVLRVFSLICSYSRP